MPDPQAASRVLRHSRREAFLVLLVWAIALVWTVGVSYLLGYQHDPQSWLVQAGLARSRGAEDFTQILGFPDWIFFGVMLPWAACTLISVLFALRGIKDDDLGAEAPEEAGHGA